MLIEILTIGTNKPIMETIARLIHTNENWKATIAFTTEEALTLVDTINFDLVLICAGIEEETALKERITESRPSLPVIKHYGGGSGLLFAEIYEGLK